MSMQPQPEGTTRVRLDQGAPSLETGKPLPPGKFGIDYKDPELGKIRIGETHRVLEGKHKGCWAPHSAAPKSALKGVQALLEPLARHNDAIAHLLELYERARTTGWVPPAAANPPAPAKPQRAAQEPPAAPEPEELTEMVGVPVIPATPEQAQAPILIPAPDRADVAASQEHGEIIQEIPAGHPDDPSTNGAQPTPPGEPIVLHMKSDEEIAAAEPLPQDWNPIPARLPPLDPALALSPEGEAELRSEQFSAPVSRPGIPGPIPPADPETQAAVMLADDWLNQPATPAAAPPFPDEGDAFPLDFP
jgi:hypothetical protein